MTREETKKVLMILQAAFPNFKPTDKTLTIDTWHMMINGYPYPMAERAVQRYIREDTSGFAPSIGQIIKYLDIPTDTPDITEMEAWSLVSRALRNSAYNYKAEFDALPPAVQRAVGSAEQLHYWALDEDYNEGVVMSQVIRSFQMASAQEKEYARLPENVQRLTQETIKSLESRDM